MREIDNQRVDLSAPIRPSTVGRVQRIPHRLAGTIQAFIGRENQG